MGISKIILDGETQIDVTQKTVAPDNLLQGKTALGANGEDVVGTLTIDEPVIKVVNAKILTNIDKPKLTVQIPRQINFGQYTGESNIVLSGSSTVLHTANKNVPFDIVVSTSQSTAILTTTASYTKDPGGGIDITNIGNGIIKYTGQWNIQAISQVNTGIISATTQMQATEIYAQESISIPTTGPTTITPTTTSTTIEGPAYLTGDIIILGDLNLQPEHIIQGVSIFGVQGTASTITISSKADFTAIETTFLQPGVWESTLDSDNKPIYLNKATFTFSDNMVSTTDDLTVQHNGTFTAPNGYGWTAITVDIGGSTVLNENGIYQAPQNQAWTTVEVAVPTINWQTLTVNGNVAATYTVEAPNGWNQVIVTGGSVVSESITLTANGTYNSEGELWNKITVNVPQPTQTSVILEANGTYSPPSTTPNTVWNQVTVSIPIFDPDWS